MKPWPRRIRGALVMGLAWAAVWAPVAVLIGTMIIDPDNSMDEMWVAIGAYPGFLCGVIFSATLGIAEAGRRIEELSLSRVGAWGALAGLLVGVLPSVIATPRQLGAGIIGSITLLSVVSAIASALLARRMAKREPRDASAHMA